MDEGNKTPETAVRILVGEYEFPAVCSVKPLDCLSKEGIAAFAAISGGDDLRHYCEYLKAHGYSGDAYADSADRSNTKERVRWAIDACRHFVSDERNLRDYLRNPDKPLGVPPSVIQALNSAQCVTLHS